MAAVDTITPTLDQRHQRRRPFTNWVRRIAGLKHHSPSSRCNTSEPRKKVLPLPTTRSRKTKQTNNNPYPLSGKSVGKIPNDELDSQLRESIATGQSTSRAPTTISHSSFDTGNHASSHAAQSTRSAAPTVITERGTIHSDNGMSKCGTTRTVDGTLGGISLGGGEGSTFSSPAPSVRSLATTLTTIQSAAPSTVLNVPHGPGQPHLSNLVQPTHPDALHAMTAPNQTPQSPLASPTPLQSAFQAGGGHPMTYETATANNLLMDNASVMTLASSSKRRRRNSLDTNASVRALAPSSVYGGSKESLPASILSAGTTEHTGSGTIAPTKQINTSLANAERASVYSSQGIVAALSSDRNSIYASKHAGGDGASVRSGRLGHVRSDSLNKGAGNAIGDSPLQSPKEMVSHSEKLSRKSSGNSRWSELKSDGDEDDQASLKRRLDH